MSLLGLLRQEITLSAKASYGADGSPTFSAGSTVKCRFMAKTKRILLPDGTTLTIDAYAVIDSDTVVATDSKATYDGHDYKVVDIYKVPDGYGNLHHQEVRLVKWH